MRGETEKALNILMTADCVGGVLTYATELARSLRDSGNSVTLAIMGDGQKSEELPGSSDLAGIKIFRNPGRLEWMDDPWEDVGRAGQWLLRLEEEIRPDIIHLNEFAHAALDWSGRAPVLAVGHSCVLSWYRAVRAQAAPHSWDLYRQAVRAGLQAADMVAAPSFAMLESLEYDYGPFRSSCFIHNGVDQSRFLPGKKTAFIFTAGRLWDDAKNVQALAMVAHDLPWPVLSAGDMGDRKPSHGPINYLGFMSRRALAAWYSRAAIYCLPARYEPFGLTALEAGLSGCALVLGDIPSLREIWDGAALFADPQDCNGLKRRILDLINDRRLRGEYSMRARKRALEYSIEKTAEAYMRVYNSMAGAALVAENFARPDMNAFGTHQQIAGTTKE